ncbi:hypothetical protein EDD18DRAFT_1161423 [Armillaria luteobubalina]|uniref:Uncharacterized protein n=1 Tax=Armillaria luteobubalina TaxID=153913 RepID=A0AA39Q8F5_9AGAR|nr:hypothetical protein EDD18DRAFT_1161423 [Armillaria luteobubalina]
MLPYALLENLLALGLAAMIFVVACNHTAPYLSVLPTLDYHRTWSFARLANNASLPPRIHNTIRDVSSSTCSRVLLTQCRPFCSICLPESLDVNLLASSRTHKYPRSHLIPHVDHQWSTRSCGLVSYFTLDSMHRPHVRVRYTCLIQLRWLQWSILPSTRLFHVLFRPYRV